MDNNLENRSLLSEDKLQESEDPIFLHLPEFSPLDNFSPFQVKINEITYLTAEHAYQTLKFTGSNDEIANQICTIQSPIDAFKLAKANSSHKRSDWNDEKVRIMKDILRNKITQNPEVLKILMETGQRIIIEDSWPDDEWGIGENKDGKNLLGKIWMELREENKIQLVKP